MELVDGRNRFPCVLCKKRTKPNDRKKSESVEIRRFLRKTFMVDARPVDVLCNKCRHQYYRNKQVKEKPICTENKEVKLQYFKTTFKNLPPQNIVPY